jgi:hypothetical protein
LHQAGSLLSTAYSNNTGWDRSKSLDLPGFFLDTAYGGSLEWETMDDRRKRPRRNVDVGKDKIDKVPFQIITPTLISDQPYAS